MVTVVVHQGLKPRSGAQHLLEVHSQQWVVTSRRQTDQNVASQCAANHHLTPPCWSLSPHPGNIYHLRLTTAQNRTEQTDHVTPGPHLQDGPADPTRLQPDSISVQLHLPDKDSKSDPSSVWVWNFRSLPFYTSLSGV